MEGEIHSLLWFIVTMICITLIAYIIYKIFENGSTPRLSDGSSVSDVVVDSEKTLGCNRIDGYRIPGAGYKLGVEEDDAIYPGFGSDQRTIDGCMIACAFDDDCKQFTYDSKNAKCYKQKKRYPYTTDNKSADWISGTCTRNKATS